ncbi:type IV secretory system conjugative DNA transfer family protein [Methylovorus glucosotrophus]|uniref:Type IV secretory pathway VirD4 protein-like protein n=1 Tax=Methylovorus glucosotrophus (strain SIP3-4) TaxID=582744 RepID=C6X7V8_METGS|nr:type IV secretion system DNA-binding domain-containing protein [Methylovorus glucosotrophus]ACT51285.1 Type IV secretory pathway VirD4 protein-like protein [Methylovorus glucosotrophus SIP3-4]
MASVNRYLWRSRFSPPAVYSGNTYIHYVEDIALFTLTYGAIGFTLGSIGAWAFDFKFYPLPPATDMIGRGFVEHFTYWSKSIVNGVFPFLFKSSVEQYSLYMATIKHYGYQYLLIPRIMFATFIGLFGATLGFMSKHSNPVKAQVETHMRGMKLLEFGDAVEELVSKFASEILKHGKFTEIAENLSLSMKRVFAHHIIFGASGTGKSQYMGSAIFDSINKGLKTLILDPKYEFTSAFYKNNGKMAIIDPTDARSHVVDLADLVASIGLIKKFAAALIPAKGNDPMWSNAARAVFTGLILYLKAMFKDDNGKPNFSWKDLADVMVSTPEQVIYIMQNYYPEALKLVGEINKETNQLTENATATSIMINLLSFMGGIRDLARFWYDDPENPQPKISLLRFMTDPNYKIKTIFIKPNDIEGEMSSCIIRAVLTYSISLLDSPKIPDSKTPNGIFFLDEFHAPGKLVNELDQPVIDKGIDRGRSKQWAFYLATQNIIQLYKIYTKEDVDSWRETTSNFILTGAPLGETASKVCEYLGEQFIDKLHTSLSGSGNGVSASSNYQEHSKKVLLPSELTEKLQITDTHIRYLAILRGLPNVYLLEKPFVDIPQVAPIWIERKQLFATGSLDNRVSESITTAIGVAMKIEQETIKTKGKDEPTIDLNKQPIIEDEGNLGDWVDTGQHADAMSEEERKFIEESVESETIKDIALESITGSHALGISTSLLDKIMEKTKNPQDNKIYQQAILKNKGQTK